MAYDLYLADRIRASFQRLNTPFTEKAMMGGICFLVNDKMCTGIVKSDLMCRIGEESQKNCMDQKHVKPMNFTGRPMKGYIFVEPEGIDDEASLDHWIAACIAFNPLAKSSKKKK